MTSKEKKLQRSLELMSISLEVLRDPFAAAEAASQSSPGTRSSQSPQGRGRRGGLTSERISRVEKKL
jgi:hypothetical protein